MCDVSQVSTAPDYRCPSGMSAPRQVIRENSRAHPIWQQQQGQDVVCADLVTAAAARWMRRGVAWLISPGIETLRARAHPGAQLPYGASARNCQRLHARCARRRGRAARASLFGQHDLCPAHRSRYRLSSATLMTQSREAGKVGTYRGSAPWLASQRPTPVCYCRGHTIARWGGSRAGDR